MAGYYDPRSGALRVIEGAQTGSRVLYETTVAHELTHALDDEHFDLDEDAVAEGGDAGLAYLALVEGSATAVMNRFMAERFSAGGGARRVARLRARGLGHRDGGHAALPGGADAVPVHVRRGGS